MSEDFCFELSGGASQSDTAAMDPSGRGLHTAGGPARQKGYLQPGNSQITQILFTAPIVRQREGGAIARRLHEIWGPPKCFRPERSVRLIYVTIC